MKRLVWAGALATLVSSNAWALPRIGAPAPEAACEDPDGHVLRLKSLLGRPVLVLYEDKGSARVNAALKEELARVAKGGRYDGRVALVPVADVSSYDHWPVRGFARNAIRHQAGKIGVPIYCDWHGTFRNALSLRRGTSSVVLLGKNGQVLFAAEGALSPGDREHLFRLVREQVGD